MSAHRHTPGPWFSDAEGGIWRRHPADLYENGGSVAGDRAVAAVYRGWYDEGSEGYPVEANARLIAAAPKLLEALTKAVKDAEQRLFEDWLKFNSPSGDHEEVQRQWHASSDYRDFISEWGEQIDAIACATGEAP